MSRDQQLNIRVTSEMLAAFERAAARTGLTPATWAMTVLLHAAGESELIDQLKRVPRPQKHMKKT